MTHPCPVCGKLYTVRPDQVGRRIGCKQCGGRLLVTASGLQAESVAPSPPPPPPPTYPAGAPAYAYQPPPAAPAAPPSPPPTVLEEPEPPPPPRRHYRTGGSPVADFLTFRLMLTPVLIQIFFWLGTVGCVGLGLSQMVASTGGSGASVRSDADDEERSAKAKSKDGAARSSFNTIQFLTGLGTLVFGPLFLRLVCEEAIILFKIHEELREQTDRARHRG